jgi:hypothetical protein
VSEWRSKRHDGKQKEKSAIDSELRTGPSPLGLEQDEGMKTASQTDGAPTEDTTRDEAGAPVDVICLPRLPRETANPNGSAKEAESVLHLDLRCPRPGTANVSAREKGKGTEIENIDHFLLDHLVLFHLPDDATIPGQDPVLPLV